MIKGTMDFRIGDEKRTMKPGDVAVIPGGVEHEGHFTEDTEVIDFFAPVREDFLTGAPLSYMTQECSVRSRACPVARHRALSIRLHHPLVNAKLYACSAQWNFAAPFDLLFRLRRARHVYDQG